MKMKQLILSQSIEENVTEKLIIDLVLHDGRTRGRSEMSSPGTESSIKHKACIMLQVIKDSLAKIGYQQF